MAFQFDLCIPRADCQYMVDTAYAAGHEYLWLLFAFAVTSAIGIYLLNRPDNVRFHGIIRNCFWFILITSITYIAWVILQ